jgi:hypothetical protein
MDNNELIQKLYEATVNNMIEVHEEETWRILRIQNPDLTDEQIKDKVTANQKERDDSHSTLLEKYNRLCYDLDVDPVVREVLKLHKPDGKYFLTCQGDDVNGWAGESPTWPCRTVDTILSNTE